MERKFFINSKLQDLVVNSRLNSGPLLQHKHIYPARQYMWGVSVRARSIRGIMMRKPELLVHDLTLPNVTICNHYTRREDRVILTTPTKNKKTIPVTFMLTVSLLGSNVCFTRYSDNFLTWFSCRSWCTNCNVWCIWRPLTCRQWRQKKYFSDRNVTRTYI